MNKQNSFSNKTIEALKMAIREMKDAIPHLDIHFDDYFEAIKKGEEALAETEKQEPVATVCKLKDENGFIVDGFNDVIYPCMPQGTKLYTHPATWQSLSDDEIKDVWFKVYPLNGNNLWADMFDGKHLFNFARAIEQALKEKNT